MALQQHFGDSGSCTEVSVNLERRMEIEEIVRGAFLEEELQMIVCCVPILKTCKEVDNPRPAPTCVPPAIAQAVFQRFAGCSREVRGAP